MTITYARLPVVRAPVGDEVPLWSATIPLEVALAADVAPKSAAIHALVNHGRWVVSCPDCSSAQLACPSDRRFMCHECANIAIGVRWRPVVWPKDPRSLSEALAGRADRRLQNLDPGETVAELLAQNAILDTGLHLPGPRYIPGADTEDEVEGAASDWEGHTHTWPKRVEPREAYTCRECDLVVHGHAIAASRNEKGGAK